MEKDFNFKQKWIVKILPFPVEDWDETTKEYADSNFVSIADVEANSLVHNKTTKH